MLRLPTRVLAVAILVFLVVAQVHVWVEARPAGGSGHACQICVSGGVAVLATTPGLDVAPAALRLEAEPPPAHTNTQRIEASAPRAPPLA